jgi:NADPH2:quinone reductase
VRGFTIGQRVYAYARKPEVSGGTYAEYISVPAASVAAYPTILRSEEAASIPLAALTAWQGLHDVATIKSGDTVLVTAGAGGVGSFAVQFAKLAGATVVATASPKNHAYVRELGADSVIDYNAPDVIEDLKKAAPSGFSVVFDGAGGNSLAAAWHVIKKGGRLVSIVETPDAATASALGVRAAFHFVSPSGKQLGEIAALAESRKLRVPALQVRSVKEAATVLDENQERHVRGKVVLAIDF